MSIDYQLCGGDGSGLVATSDGKLVVALASVAGVSVQVTARNPACSTAGSGWYTAWVVKIGGGASVNGGAAQSAGDPARNPSTTYSNGTLTTQNSVVIFLQLMAWHGDEKKPDGTTPLPTTDIQYNLKFDADGVSRTLGGNFMDTVANNLLGVPLDTTKPYYRIEAKFDFVNRAWIFMPISIVTP